MDTENKITVEKECEKQETADFSIENIISRFPEEKQPLLKDSLSETETALRNYLFSLVM